MTTKTKTEEQPVNAPLVTLEDKRARLRAEFPKAAYGKLPKSTKKDNPKGNCKECGGYHGLPAVHLDYIGHATVTDRLLEVDPEWTWEPCAFGDDGLPRFIISEAGTPIGLWIKLTVLGVTRLGFGSVESNAFEPEKQLIGDAMRNAAMRFGVALDLWSKAELESAALAHEARVQVNTRTGEVTSAAPAKLPERTQAPRTVDVQATKPEPASVQPAASQEPQEIDWSAVPTYREDGAMVCWGVPVEEKVHKGFNNWKRYLAVEDVRSKSCLKNKSWDQVVHGGGTDNTPLPTIDGKRVQALQFVVGKALTEDAALGKLSIQWRQRAVWCLWLIYEEHRNREEDAARNADFKEQTGIEIDPNGSSADAVPF